MAGTVNIARGLWDDPTFKDAEMSQREAWIWMIAEASWKDRTKRVGSTEIELERAQLAASTRFMAAAWMWSEARVRRYLDMLENRRMIQRKIDAGVTVITICKYDDYQAQPKDIDAAATQQSTQQRRTVDANEKKGERREKEGEEDIRRFSADLLGNEAAEISVKADRFDEFWKVYPGKHGKPAAKKAWVKALKRSSADQIIAAARVYAGQVAGNDPKYTKWPQGWLNEERFLDDDLQPVHKPNLSVEERRARMIAGESWKRSVV